MRRARFAIVFVALVGLAFGWLPARPAAAIGATNVEFTISGTLPTFPCEQCTTGFGGTGTGAGRAAALVGSDVYDATFTILGAGVSGYADYGEPGLPFCPLLGSAANPTDGWVTLSGGQTTGVVYRTSTPTLFGTVTDISLTFSFTYVRVGVTPAIVITGGWLNVYYSFPGSGPGVFTRSVLAGAGSGVFVVDPVQAETRCLTPGDLPFTIIGNAAVATV